MKHLTEMIYQTLISTIVGIANDSYLNGANGLNKKDYAKWLKNLSQASRACNEACENKLQEISE